MASTARSNGRSRLTRRPSSSMKCLRCRGSNPCSLGPAGFPALRTGRRLATGVAMGPGGEHLASTASKTGSSSRRREKAELRSVGQPAVPVARGHRRSRHGHHIVESSNRVVGLVRGCSGAGRHLTRGLVVGKQLDDGGLRGGDRGADRLGRVGRKANAVGLTEGRYSRFRDRIGGQMKPAIAATAMPDGRRVSGRPPFPPRARALR